MANTQQPRFNLETMSGVFAGTRTQVFQRVILLRPRSAQVGEQTTPNARLAWYTEPAACVVTQDGEEDPLLQLEATLETEAERAAFWSALLDGLEDRNAQLRTCGTCSHYNSAAAQGADGLVVGRCNYGVDAAADTGLDAGQAHQSVLGLACVHWQNRAAQIMWSTGGGVARGSEIDSSQQVGEAARVATGAGDGRVQRGDSFISKNIDAATEPEQKHKSGHGFFAKLGRLVGRGNPQPLSPNAVVGERPEPFEERSGMGAGTEPCFACEGRLANLGAWNAETDEGDSQTFSVWRCRVCRTFYLNQWVDKWVRLDNLETEEVYYRLAPSEAIMLLRAIESKDVSLEQFNHFVTSRSALSHQIKHGR